MFLNNVLVAKLTASPSLEALKAAEKGQTQSLKKMLKEDKDLINCQQVDVRVSAPVRAGPGLSSVRVVPCPRKLA